MKLKDTRIAIGGLMRCCIETISGLDPEAEWDGGAILDCKYEGAGNKRIILDGGVWRWNQKSEIEGPPRGEEP